MKGQAVLEYVLLMSVVLGMIAFVFGHLKRTDYIFKNLTAPIVRTLKYNYKYGDAKALGWDEQESGGPRSHIHIGEPEGQSFKLFFPSPKQ